MKEVYPLVEEVMSQMNYVMDNHHETFVVLSVEHQVVVKFVYDKVFDSIEVSQLISSTLGISWDMYMTFHHVSTQNLELIAQQIVMMAGL